MIIVELIRARRPGEARLAARVRGKGREISVDGPEPELIDRTQHVLSLRNGRRITYDDDPEEWMRGLAASFRTPFLSARIAVDTNAPPDVEIPSTSVREPLVVRRCL